MAEVVDELLVRLGLETDAKGFRDANNQFSGVRSAALKLGAVIGGGMGIHDLTVGFAKSTDELGKWSKAAGVAIGFADRVQHAMNKFGGTNADARALIDRVNDIRESANWGEIASRAFTAAGFNPQRIQQERMGTEETLDFLSKGISSIADIDQRRRVLDALGIGGPYAQNMLSDRTGFLTEMNGAGQLGVVTDQMAANAARFNDSVTDASRLMESFKNNLSNELLPNMSSWIEAATKWGIENRSEIEEAFKEAMPYFKATAAGIAVLVAAQAGKKGLTMLAGAAAANGPAAALVGLGAFYMDEENRTDAVSSFKGGINYQVGQWKRRLGLSNGGGEVKSGDGPLALNAIFSALIQQESGGRHYGADGRLLRSGAGALGITQIMPGTAKNPGYGISPLKNDSKEEYLRVGREYFYAMVKEFDGDTQKALAAYNAGPGTVKRAVDLAGANWLSAMPGETQAYVPSIMDRASKSGTTNYYSIDARGSTDPAATEAAVRRVVDERIQNAAQISRDDFPNNVE